MQKVTVENYFLGSITINAVKIGFFLHNTKICTQKLLISSCFFILTLWQTLRSNIPFHFNVLSSPSLEHFHGVNVLSSLSLEHFCSVNVLSSPSPANSHSVSVLSSPLPANSHSVSVLSTPRPHISAVSMCCRAPRLQIPTASVCCRAPRSNISAVSMCCRAPRLHISIVPMCGHCLRQQLQNVNHTESGRGGDCAPTRTSAQPCLHLLIILFISQVLRFHLSPLHFHSKTRNFRLYNIGVYTVWCINLATSALLMSNVGRHAGSDLTMLHETLLPASALFAFCHRRGDFCQDL